MRKKNEVVYEKDLDMDLDHPVQANDFDNDFDLGPDPSLEAGARSMDDYPVFETRIFEDEPGMGDGPRPDAPAPAKAVRDNSQAGRPTAKPGNSEPGREAARIDQLEKRIRRLELKTDHVIKLLRYISSSYNKKSTNGQT